MNRFKKMISSARNQAETILLNASSTISIDQVNVAKRVWFATGAFLVLSHFFFPVFGSGIGDVGTKINGLTSEIISMFGSIANGIALSMLLYYLILRLLKSGNSRAVQENTGVIVTILVTYIMILSAQYFLDIAGTLAFNGSGGGTSEGQNLRQG